jgi:hypothetical protein
MSGQIGKTIFRLDCLLRKANRHIFTRNTPASFDTSFLTFFVIKSQFKKLNLW